MAGTILPLIQLKRSAVAAKVPLTTNLALGELAVNTYDGKVYTKKNVSGTETIVDLSIASKLGTARTIALSGEATGSIGFDGSANVTIPVTLVGVVKTTSNLLPLTQGDISSSTLTTSTTTANQVADTFTASVYRTAKYLIQAVSGTSYHAVEVLLIHDGTTVQVVEYATVFTGASLISINADISTGLVRLLVTPTNAATTIRCIRTAIDV